MLSKQGKAENKIQNSDHGRAGGESMQDSAQVMIEISLN